MPEELGDATDTELTEARAKSVAGDKKQIILTFVNKVRLDFAKTWAYHVVRLGLTNYLIGATDVGSEAKARVLALLSYASLGQGRRRVYFIKSAHAQFVSSGKFSSFY